MLFSQATFLGISYLIAKLGAVAGDTSSGSGNGSSVATSSAFHMALDLPGSKLRRRARSYITDQGYVTTDQSQAAVYYISNQQLVDTNGNIVAAAPTDEYIIFAPSSGSILDLISTTWTNDGSLQWYNILFAGDGIATYCQGSDSHVYIVLQKEPDACVPAVASPVPTASASATSTSTSASSAPTANGIAYYGYARQATDDTVASFNGDSSDVDITGVAQDIQFSTTPSLNGDETTFPGQSNPTVADEYTVVYQGYFLAPITATFTLTSPGTTDNELWMWTGETAFSAWNDGNFAARSIFPTTDGSTSFQLNAGDTLPVTIVWTNQGGPGTLFFTVTDSNGDVNSGTAGYFALPIQGDGFSNSGFT